MSIALIAGIVVVAIIVAIAIAQRSRPRVTHIDDAPRDEDKDGDDA